MIAIYTNSPHACHVTRDMLWPVENADYINSRMLIIPDNQIGVWTQGRRREDTETQGRRWDAGTEATGTEETQGRKTVGRKTVGRKTVRRKTLGRKTLGRKTLGRQTLESG